MAELGVSYVAGHDCGNCSCPCDGEHPCSWDCDCPDCPQPEVMERMQQSIAEGERAMAAGERMVTLDDAVADSTASGTKRKD